MSWKNKGQVTMFIIIGILILASLIIVSLIYSRTADMPEEDIGVNTPEYDALKRYVDDCFQESVDEGIELMSLQGGFIYNQFNYPEANISSLKTVVGTDEAKAVIDIPGTNNMPYWITDNKVNFPSIDLIEEQFEEYLDRRVLQCIDEFKSFKKQGYEVEYSYPLSDVDFQDKVDVSLYFPIEAKLMNSEMKISEFSYVKDINFRRVYNTALKIMSYEDMFGFLESDTKRLISLYSGLDEEKLPPMTMTTTNTDCSFVTWDEKEVEEKMKNILEKNIPLVRISNSLYDPIEYNSDEEKEFMESFKHDAGLVDSNMKINFDYDGSMINFDIRPGSGPGIAEPDKLSSTSIPLLPQFCSFRYKYKYDVEYPVVVKITDYDSEKSDSSEKGFEFKFPVWVFLCGNNERFCTGDPEYMSTGFAVNEDVLEESGYVDINFCSNKNTNVTLNVLNEEGDKLDDVSVRYICGSYSNSCLIGSTNEGLLNAKFPSCYNGVIELNKKGYGKKNVVISTSGNHEMVSTRMNKEKEVDVDIKVIRVDDFIKSYLTGNEFTSSDLMGREDVVITGRGASSFSYVYPSLVRDKISLNKGKYVLDIMTKADLRIKSSYIGETEISYDEDGSGTYDGDWITGSIKDMEWEVNSLGDEVIFYVLVEHRPNDDLDTKKVSDSFFDNDGNIIAEILYRQKDCKGDYEIVGMSGLIERDYDAGDCEKVEDVMISKKEYSEFVRPEFR